jgi:hypothetical protein
MAAATAEVEPVCDSLVHTPTTTEMAQLGVRLAARLEDFEKELESKSHFQAQAQDYGHSEDIISVTSSIASAESSTIEYCSTAESDDDVMIFCCGQYQPIGLCPCDA